MTPRPNETPHQIAQRYAAHFGKPVAVRKGIRIQLCPPATFSDTERPKVDPFTGNPVSKDRSEAYRKSRKINGLAAGRQRRAWSEQNFEKHAPTIQRLHAEGKNDHEIASVIGYGHSTARKWRIRLGLAPQKRGGRS